MVCPLMAHLFFTWNCEDTKGAEREDSTPSLGRYSLLCKNTIKLYDSALRTQRSEPQIAVKVGGIISNNLWTVRSAFTGLLHMPASQNAHLTGKLGLKNNLGSSGKDKLIVTLVFPHSCPSPTHSFLSQGHLEYEVCLH